MKDQVLHHSENFLAVDKMPDLVMNTEPGDERYMIVYRLEVMENWPTFIDFPMNFWGSHRIFFRLSLYLYLYFCMVGLTKCPFSGSHFIWIVGLTRQGSLFFFQKSGFF